MPLGRNKGGGVGRRPTPGDIRPKGIPTRRPVILRTSAFRSGRKRPLLRRPDAACDSLRPMSAESLPLFPLHTVLLPGAALRSEEHTSELQSLMRISYAVFCLKKKKNNIT